MHVMFTFLVALSFVANCLGSPVVFGDLRKICYSDLNNLCVVSHFRREGTTSSLADSIYFSTEDFNAFPTDMKAKASLSGINIEILPPSVTAELERRQVQTETRVSTHDTAQSDVNDAAWDAFVSGTACTSAVFACATGAASLVETMFLSYIVMYSKCIGAGIICTDTGMKIDKYLDKHAQFEKEKKENEATSGSGGSGGGPGAPANANTGSSKHWPAFEGGGLEGGGGGEGGTVTVGGLVTIADDPCGIVPCMEEEGPED
jgi:hypothetical protein